MKEIYILAIEQFSYLRNRSVEEPYHIQYITAGTSSCWSHAAVGWHPILQPAFVTSQTTWLCWSLWIEQHAQADPQLFTGVEVRTAGRPSSLMNPLWVQAFLDRVWSQTVEIWDCHWLQNLIPISLCIEIASNDDEPGFSSERDAVPHHHTAPTKRFDSIGAAIGIEFSAH